MVALYTKAFSMHNCEGVQKETKVFRGLLERSSSFHNRYLNFKFKTYYIVILYKLEHIVPVGIITTMNYSVNLCSRFEMFNAR